MRQRKEIVAVNGHYVLRDLESTNHSFVNGEEILEIDLTESCKITFGTVQCDYLPDNAKATGPVADVDTLRKNVGILRSQNKELVSKIAEQNKQIEILGSAKLVIRENGDLKYAISQLKAVTQAFGGAAQSTDLKETVPIKLAPSPSLPVPVMMVTPPIFSPRS